MTLEEKCYFCKEKLKIIDLGHKKIDEINANRNKESKRKICFNCWHDGKDIENERI